MSEKNYCALTFDDGPNLTTTVDMIGVLKKHNVRASFFVCGKNINDETSSIIAEAVACGCSIENHSFSHSRMTGLSAEEIKNEIETTSRLVKSAAGMEPEFFRAPYIAADENVFKSIELPFIEGENCQDWVDEVSADQRLETILSTISSGSILLLHDSEGNDATVECVDRLIPVLKERGYEFCTVREIFEIFHVNPKVYGRQWKNVRLGV